MKKRLLIISSVVMATGYNIHCTQEKMPIKDIAPEKETLESIKLEGTPHASELTIDARTVAHRDLNAFLYGTQLRQSICRPIVEEAIENCLRPQPLGDAFSSIRNDTASTMERTDYTRHLVSKNIMEIFLELTEYPACCIADMLGIGNDEKQMVNFIGEMLASISGSGAQKEKIEYVVSLAILCSYSFDKFNGARYRGTSYRRKIREYLLDGHSTFSPDECLIFFTSLLLNLREVKSINGNISKITSFLHALFSDADVKNIRDAMKIAFHANFFPEIARLFRSNRDLQVLEKKFFRDCCFGRYIDIDALNGIVTDMGNICPPDLVGYFRASFQRGELSITKGTLPRIIPTVPLDGKPKAFMSLYDSFIDIVWNQIYKTVVVRDDSALLYYTKTVPAKSELLSKTSVDTDDSNIVKKHPELCALPIVSSLATNNAAPFRQNLVILNRDYERTKDGSQLMALVLYMHRCKELVDQANSCQPGETFQYFVELDKAMQTCPTFSVDLNNAKDYLMCTETSQIRIEGSGGSSGGGGGGSSSDDDDDDKGSFFHLSYNDDTVNCLNYQDLKPLKDATLAIADKHSGDPYYNLIARGDLCYLKTFFERLLMRALLLCSLDIEMETKELKDKEGRSYSVVVVKLYDEYKKEFIKKDPEGRCGIPMGVDVFGLDAFELDTFSTQPPPPNNRFEKILPKNNKVRKIGTASQVKGLLKDGVGGWLYDIGLITFIRDILGSMSEKSQKNKIEQQPAKARNANMNAQFSPGGITVPDDSIKSARHFFGSSSSAKAAARNTSVNELFSLDGITIHDDSRRSADHLGLSSPSASYSTKRLAVEDIFGIDCGHMHQIFACNTDFSDTDTLSPSNFSEQILTVLEQVRQDIESGPGTFLNMDLFRYILCKFYGLVSTLDRDIADGRRVYVEDMVKLGGVTGILLQSLHKCPNARIEGIFNAINYLIEPEDFKWLSSGKMFSLLNALVTNEVFIETFRFGDYNRKTGEYETYEESARWVALAMRGLNGRYGMNKIEDKIEDDGSIHKLEKRNEDINGQRENYRGRGRCRIQRKPGECPIKLLNNYLRKHKAKFLATLPPRLISTLSFEDEGTDDFFDGVVNALMDEAMKRLFFPKMTSDIYGRLMHNMSQKYRLESTEKIIEPNTDVQKVNLLCDVMYKYGMLKDKSADTSGGLPLDSLLPQEYLQNLQSSTYVRTSVRPRTLPKRNVRGPSSTTPLTVGSIPMTPQEREAALKRQSKAATRKRKF